jgi:protein ImuB
LRTAVFKGYQLGGGITQISIETNAPTSNPDHLYKLFEIRLPIIQTQEGIELFVLEAKRVENLMPGQEKLWEGSGALNDAQLSELLDRLTIKTGAQNIHRYLPCEHHWPERSFRPAKSLEETTKMQWRDKPRPVLFLSKPEPIEVTAPIPDYPPMLFRYKGILHKITKADGPERIEQEWWIEEGEHRDYYYVEDEEGRRYWLFRSGHYNVAKTYGWFIHGFFS